MASNETSETAAASPCDFHNQGLAQSHASQTFEKQQIQILQSSM